MAKPALHSYSWFEGWHLGDLPGFGASACKNFKQLKKNITLKVGYAGKWIYVTHTLSAAQFRWWFQTLPEIVLHPVSLIFFFLRLTIQFCVTCQWVRSFSKRRGLPRWWQITSYMPIESLWGLKCIIRKNIYNCVWHNFKRSPLVSS